MWGQSENSEICNINWDNVIEDSSIDNAPFVSMQTEGEKLIELINTFIYTIEISVENSLLKLVSDINAINEAFKKIMDWAKALGHFLLSRWATWSKYNVSCA